MNGLRADALIYDEAAAGKRQPVAIGSTETAMEVREMANEVDGVQAPQEIHVQPARLPIDAASSDLPPGRRIRLEGVVSSVTSESDGTFVVCVTPDLVELT